MAFSASMVWECRTGGSDANGGGFVTGATGTDYSQQNAAQVAYTDLVINAVTNTQCTSIATPFTSLHVGNVINITGGTGFTVQRVQIVSVSSGIATCDKSLGTLSSVSGTGNLGGAFLSPAIPISLSIAGNVTYAFNAGGSVFSITSASTGIAAGCFGASTACLLVGYATNRTIINTDAQPTIQLNVSTATMFSSSSVRVFNVILDGNSQTAAKLTTGTDFVNCTVKNFNTASTGSSTMFGCLVTGNSALVGLCTYLGWVEAYGNTATAISASIAAVNVLTYSNTGATTRGISISLHGENITAVANGSDGILVAVNNQLHYLQNCILQSNAGFGINGASLNMTVINNCAFYNNTSGQVSGTAPNTYNFNPITLSGDAFSNLAGNVYSLNNTASQGAALRAAALPALFPRGLTPDYLDVGCAQHADPAPSGGLACNPIGGFFA